MIVLSILKWIGIVLGCLVLGLLALALLILLVVLFVPVRYGACVSTGGVTSHKKLWFTGYNKQMPEDKKFGYGFHITWLLHAISVKKRLGEDQVVIRILGIPVRRIGGDAGKTTEDETENEIWEPPEMTETEDASIPEKFESGLPETAETAEAAEAAEPASEPEEVLPEPEETGEPPGEESGGPSEPEETVEPEEAPSEKKRRRRKNAEPEPLPEPKLTPFERLVKRIRDKKNALKNKIKQTFKKIGFLFYKIRSIIDLVHDKTTRRTGKRLLKEVIKAIRYVLPVRFVGTLVFGTGDPGSTGLILSGVSLCPLAYKKDVSITPNFEEKCLIGDCAVRGRIRAVYFLRMALRIWFDKDVHRLWKRYRRMKRQIKKHGQEIGM